MKKKWINLLAIMAAVCMLAGCGNDNGSDNVSDSGSNNVSDSGSNIGSADQTLQEMDVDKYVTIGEYKGLTVTVDPISVDESEVDSLVAGAYSGAVTAENGGITDRAVAVGDTANIDYVGKKDDVAFDGGTASGYNLTIGSGQFIPGFEDGLVGVMPGETVDLNLTFPEGYQNAELAGAEVVFTVTVNFIIPTEMEDSVVATLGIEGVDTVEGLRQYAYDYLYSEAEYNYEMSVENAVLNAFMTNCVFNEIPQNVVDRYTNMASGGITQQAAYYGMDAESFVSTFYGMTMDEFVANYSQEAAKQDIALQAVANREKLGISDEELDTTLQEYSAAAGYATVEEYLAGESKETYRAYLMCEKVLDFMVENAVVNNE